jgi:glycosyltransferase involved in cell wall biosynthesis
MVSVIYCTRQSNPEHTQHLIKTSGLDKRLEVIEIINNGESLTTAYNRGLTQATNDIVVFCHDDIEIQTKQWATKLLKLFTRNPEYGILGVAGTKHLPSSGMWWENKNKMYGRVAHTHEGKTWLSSYSGDLNQNIEETVVVDGVFFAIDKTKIKKTFNETVEGFHFYDVTFCFENYLEGVKVGVSTVIRINHKSIGMTNEQWETNRANFAEKFKDKLPASIKKQLRKGEKLKIMFTSLSFDDTSVKSKIMLELANKLKKAGHEVTICSNMNGKIPNIAKVSGLGLAPVHQPPGFALGDGKWTLNTVDGPKPSQPKTLYKVKDMKFSIIHIFDNELIDHMNKLYSGGNFVSSRFTNSLFVSDEENPLIKKYVDLSNDLEDTKKIDVSEIINSYLEII